MNVGIVAKMSHRLPFLAKWIFGYAQSGSGARDFWWNTVNQSKLQALENYPAGRTLDLEDIKALIHIHGKNLDWESIREYVRVPEVES